MNSAAADTLTLPSQKPSQKNQSPPSSRETCLKPRHFYKTAERRKEMKEGKQGQKDDWNKEEQQQRRGQKEKKLNCEKKERKKE